MQSLGGNLEQGVMPTLGSAAFDQAMDQMNLEMPLITYAMQLMSHTEDISGDCTRFYNDIGFTGTQLEGICNNMLLKDIDFSSHYYLMGMYFYEDKFNGLYFNFFLNQTGLTKE